MSAETSVGTEIEVQYAVDHAELPSESQLQSWARAALEGEHKSVVIRLVSSEESAQLNQTYRHKAGATNVLSFAQDVPADIPNDHLGDLVICAPVVQREAQQQGKALSAHWAHMVVHGCLHLQGWNHEQENAALAMEQKEREILHNLGFDDPYA